MAFLFQGTCCTFPSISKKNTDCRLIPGHSVTLKETTNLQIAPCSITLYHMIPQENLVRQALGQPSDLLTPNPRVELLGRQNRKYAGLMLMSCPSPLAYYIY